MTRTEMIDTLKERNMSITFTKKDGTERIMNCTLRPDALPEITELTRTSTKRREPDGAIAVWDLDQSAWRSFRYDSVVEIV